GSLSAGTVTWSIGALASGASTTVHLVVQVDPAQTSDVSNTATVTGDQSDPDASNDSATVTTTVTPAPPQTADLVLVKTVNQPAPAEGREVLYQIPLTNHGPADATGVVVKDLLPSGLLYVSSHTAHGS